ncbi:D-amino acid dehydrogenase small subunit [Wickerhamomyces ciferrii]|uniref:D-amino acid dehydrogenase small subunit n=1 Tax=Wickerhamomyces ciferrii (strain ATCC 14091 / BCRC 22168 / CBS 111 / JCM 3599 / NBRC 0793 / NRRL Y-1031 F-60-10) TaxID=1206466 RepID=K0KU53_WICCF|nr:D-amino acid dehydrogenase small subunit [Wickerhamomyces ciferrii]CCH44949.1 D-amino acid dehydrogenase small subunit [Wickerhamomyces ciferrii]
MSHLEKDSKIILVGAGVFGLSNALHLAQNGYTNITVFDRLDFNSNHYTFLEGADTASGDLNKIFRSRYEDKKHYQDLAFKAFDIWQKWNRELPLVPQNEAEKYTGLKIFDHCGMLLLDDVISEGRKKSGESFAKEGLDVLIYDINKEVDIKRANFSGFGNKIKFATDLKEKIPDLKGSLDVTSGMLYASRGCQYAKYQAEKLGVKFILGGEKGTFKDYIYKDETQKEVGGIITQDGQNHIADLVVINSGPWSTSLVPELDGINEATSGNVVIIKIPKDRKDLLEKYSSKNHPIIGWKVGHDREKSYQGGIMIFPVTEPEGIMKMFVRQTKYTNPIVTENGQVISIPKTSNSDPPFQYLTRHIIDQVKSWLQDFFPDLVQAGIELETKIIWYTDTINNDYIYDFVPGKNGLFVACGGSGHAFKMLPVLGQFLVDKIEGRSNIYTETFKWKDPQDFPKDVNGLKEKLKSERQYDKQVLSGPEDMKF